jgi:hypothetical protein
MNTKNNIGAEVVTMIAWAIGRCDFRTTISRYTTSDNQPWVITVGESNWQRHLIVKDAVINEKGLSATLGVLSTNESDKFGYDVNTNNVVRVIELKQLVSENYIGVKKILFPPNKGQLSDSDEWEKTIADWKKHFKNVLVCDRADTMRVKLYAPDGGGEPVEVTPLLVGYRADLTPLQMLYISTDGHDMRDASYRDGKWCDFPN